jgi:hypothetical protein
MCYNYGPLDMLPLLPFAAAFVPPVDDGNGKALLPPALIVVGRELGTTGVCCVTLTSGTVGFTGTITTLPVLPSMLPVDLSGQIRQ